MCATLTATLEVVPTDGAPPEALTATATLHNRGDGRRSVDVYPLSVPALALEVTDATAAPVELPPPPVPGGGTDIVTLAPNERHAIEYRGFVPEGTQPGSYRVRLQYTFRPDDPPPDAWTGTLTSEWVEFEVRR